MNDGCNTSESNVILFDFSLSQLIYFIVLYFLKRHRLAIYLIVYFLRQCVFKDNTFTSLLNFIQ